MNEILKKKSGVSNLELLPSPGCQITTNAHKLLEQPRKKRKKTKFKNTKEKRRKPIGV